MNFLKIISFGTINNLFDIRDDNVDHGTWDISEITLKLSQW